MMNRTGMGRRILPGVTRAVFIAGWFAATLIGTPGCQPPGSKVPAPPPAVQEDPTVAVQSSAGGAKDAEDVQEAAVRETWDAVFMGGAKVGHTRTRFESVQDDGQELVRINAVSELSLRRFNQTVEQKITVSSVEHPDGRLVSFSSSMGTPPNETATQGFYENRQLRLTTTTPGKSEETTLAWDPTWRGFFGAEQTLLEKPMQPGQKRTIRTLMAVFNMIGEIDFTAVGYESTKLLGEQRSLLRIESRTRIAGTSIDSVLWTDQQGETIKTSIPSLNQETYRTTREIALGANDVRTFDLGEASIVKTARPLPRPHLTEQIVYRATIPDGDPAKTFPAGSTQSVKRLDDHTAEITVRALRPETAVERALAPGQPPAAEDLQPGSLIQSDDAEVVKIAGSVAQGETNPWLIAQALEKRVRDLVEVTEFSQAIASAAEVARTRQGDCTEHAMLLAAACRARRIPARVAIGLVYYGQAGGFAYHMWTEVWIGRHWIPLDATLGQGGIGAAHLKVADSNLAGGSGYSAILPVFEVIGRLKLEIVAVDGQP